MKLLRLKGATVKHMLYARIMLLTLAVFIFNQAAVSAGPPHTDDKIGQARHRIFSANKDLTISVSFRVQPHHTIPMLICRMSNKGPGNAAVDELFHLDNSFVFIRNGQRMWIGYTARSQNITIVKEGQQAAWNVSLQQLVEFAGGGNWMPGQTSRIQWKCANTLSRPLWISVPDQNGIVAPPCHDQHNTTVSPIVAIVFRESKPHELGFFFLNDTDEDIKLEGPLTQASRIVASNPVIKYTHELYFNENTAEMATVEPGKVGEWRLPWQTVYDLIPESDIADIKAAGGDLDLVWKVGEYASSPLPISLAILQD